MEIIEVKTEQGNKIINGRTLYEILKNYDSRDREYSYIFNIFNKIKSEEDLINELRRIKNNTTPISILMIIKSIGNLSISDANPILDKVLEK